MEPRLASIGKTAEILQRENKPSILIVGGGEAELSAEIQIRLRKDYGSDLIIISPEDAKERGIDIISEGLRKPGIDPFLPEPMMITALPREVVYESNYGSNKPWYAHYDNKKHKRKHK
jgi:hypothetical protein